MQPVFELSGSVEELVDELLVEAFVGGAEVCRSAVVPSSLACVAFGLVEHGVSTQRVDHVGILRSEALAELAAELEAFVSTVPARSPRCDAAGRLRRNGFRVRCGSFQVGGETVYLPRFRPRRVDCRACGVGSTLSPTPMLPRRRYQLGVIQHAVAALLGDPSSTEEAVARRHGCARRTVGRWLRWLAPVDPRVLTQQLLAVTGETIVALVSWAQRRVLTPAGTPAIVKARRRDRPLHPVPVADRWYLLEGGVREHRDLLSVVVRAADVGMVDVLGRRDGRRRVLAIEAVYEDGLHAPVRRR